MNIKENKDSSELRKLKKDSRKLMVAVMLFAYRVRITTFFVLLMKRTFRMLLWSIPTVTYNDMTIPFAKFYNASKGDLKQVIRFGFNKQKAFRALKKITDDKINTFGILDEMKKEMLQEARILIAEADSLKDARKENRYERMRDAFLDSKKNFVDYSLTDISIQIGSFFKEMNVDLNKMSLFSVMSSFEIIRNGTSE